MDLNTANDQISSLNTTCKFILDLIKRYNAPIITSENYNNLSDEERAERCDNRPFDSWDAWKRNFRSFQADKFGFQWEFQQGPGGHPVLRNINLKFDAGRAFALIARDDKWESGTLSDLIREKCEHLGQLLNKPEIVTNYNDFSNGFKTSQEGNSYRFRRGPGDYFTLSKDVYKYTVGSRYAEKKLGEAIEFMLKNNFGFSRLEHCQENRTGGIYQNADFIGLTVNSGISRDSIELTSFELKRSNSIDDISKAISQAANYLGKSNRTYIIIPKLHDNTFHDPERLPELLEVCGRNGIGAISINLDNRDKVLSINEVQPAPFSEVLDNSWVKDQLAKSKLNPCPLCNRVVENDTDLPHNCGWKIATENDSICMKTSFEKLAQNAVINSPQQIDVTESTATSSGTKTITTKKRGRPPGSKNKKK